MLLTITNVSKEWVEFTKTLRVNQDEGRGGKLWERFFFWRDGYINQPASRHVIVLSVLPKAIGTAAL
jgi:hypothetical protein